MFPCLLNKSILGMPCASDNQRLLILIVLSDFISSLIAIHDRHVAVHEDDSIFLLLGCSQGFEPISSGVDQAVKAGLDTV
jgi:hypothetical protein